MATIGNVCEKRLAYRQTRPCKRYVFALNKMRLQYYNLKEGESSLTPMAGPVYPTGRNLLDKQTARTYMSKGEVAARLEHVMMSQIDDIKRWRGTLIGESSVPNGIIVIALAYRPVMTVAV